MYCTRHVYAKEYATTYIKSSSEEKQALREISYFLQVLSSRFKKLHLLGLESIESFAVIDEANNINLKYIETINVENCSNLEYLNAGNWNAPKMIGLNFYNCESLKVLPENMWNLFPSLESLGLIQCLNLEALPHSGLHSSLRTLKIWECKKLIANRSSWGLQQLLSLSSFEIIDFECEDLESFPEEGLLPSSLSSLEIKYVRNLRSLNGKSFQLLTCLEELQLWNCSKLRCLPEQGLHISLSTLHIRYCPLLESRCQREKGEDWSKIARIPNIHIS